MCIRDRAYSVCHRFQHAVKRRLKSSLGRRIDLTVYYYQHIHQHHSVILLETETLSIVWSTVTLRDLEKYNTKYGFKYSEIFSYHFHVSIETVV